MVKLLVFIVAAIASTQTAYAYPQFIGKGYHACLTCHYNPFGNGPLNDYGRGVAATGLAGRFLIPDSVTDDELGKRSSIFFGQPDKLPVKPSLDYRGIQIRRNLQSDPAPDPIWINMQAELSLSANWGKRKEYVITASMNTLIANNPQAGGNSALSGKEEDTNIQYIREAYFGYRVSQELGVYLGKTDKIYGVRIADHNLYNRNGTRNNFNSSAPGVMVHYGTPDYDAGVMIYQEEQNEPDNEKTNPNPRTGFSGKYEYSINKRWRVGFSHLNETDTETDLNFNASALIGKTRVGEGSSIMAELGQTNEEKSSGDTTTAQYIYLQSHMYMKRGLYFVTTYEQIVRDVSTYNEVHNFGLGVQWFPLQRFEFRLDLFDSKTYQSDVSASDGGQRDSWNLLSQVHLWF